MDRKIAVGSTNQIIDMYISSTTYGSAKTALAYNTGSLVGYYHRNTASAEVSAPLVTMTAGTWTSGGTGNMGFVKINDTNMPGVYNVGLPDAALTAGADSVSIMIKGAATTAPAFFTIELTKPTRPVTNLVNVLFKNVASQRIVIYAYNKNSCEAATGLASNTFSSSLSIDGSAFASRSISWTEIGSGYYISSAGLQQGDTNGDLLVFSFSNTNPVIEVPGFVIQTSAQVPQVRLTSDGLDAISVTEASASTNLSGLTMRDRLWLLSQRFLGKVTKSGTVSGSISIYNNASDDVLRSQTTTDDGLGNQSVDSI